MLPSEQLDKRKSGRHTLSLRRVKSVSSAMHVRYSLRTSTAPGEAPIDELDAAYLSLRMGPIGPGSGLLATECMIDAAPVAFELSKLNCAVNDSSMREHYCEYVARRV